MTCWNLAGIERRRGAAEAPGEIERLRPRGHQAIDAEPVRKRLPEHGQIADPDPREDVRVAIGLRDERAGDAQPADARALERVRGEMAGGIEHGRHRAMDVAEDAAAEAIAHRQPAQFIEREARIAIEVLEEDERVAGGHADPEVVRLMRGHVAVRVKVEPVARVQQQGLAHARRRGRRAVAGLRHPGPRCRSRATCR